MGVWNVGVLNEVVCVILDVGNANDLQGSQHEMLSADVLYSGWVWQWL